MHNTWKQLFEALQSTINNASGSSSAVIRLRSAGSPIINKLVHVINTNRNVLFVNRVEDNGFSIKFSFGKLSRPHVELIVQRKNNGLMYGPRSFGYRANHIVGEDGKKLGCCIALVQITDRTGVYGSGGINTRLSDIARVGTSVRGNDIVGIPLNKDTIEAISDWMRKVAVMQSANQIARSWNRLVKSV